MPNTGSGSDLDLLSRDAEPEPADTLVILDILFCDNENDPEILERYFSRFQHTLASVLAQEVPEGTELLATVQVSRDKQEWVARIAALISTSPASHRTRVALYLYDHPENGYEGGDPSRIDWVKKPNLHSPLREQMFIASHSGLHLDRYSRVIRVGLDDDDLWMPWQTANLVAVADAAGIDPRVEHQGVLAIGMLDTLVAYAGEDGFAIDSVQLKRSLTGEKYYVIDEPDSLESLAPYSPSAVPEKVDIEFHERFARRGIGLYAAGGFTPGFVYMRWGQNLSRQGKEYLETQRFGRLEVRTAAEIALIAPDAVPRGNRRQWFSVPGETAPLRVRARRVGISEVRVESNLAEQPGKGLKVSYYLMNGAERLQTRWYSTAPEASFADVPPGVTIRAFVRAADGTMTRAESEKV